MLRVFISYARQDYDFARELYVAFNGEGLYPWMDLRGVEPGADWSEKIRKALDGSDALVVIVSPESEISSFVTFEWSYAMGRGVPVIPIALNSKSEHLVLSSIQHYELPLKSEGCVQGLIDLVVDTADPMFSLISELQQSCNSTESKVRLEALFQISKIDSSRVGHAMKTLARSRYPDVSKWAAILLGRDGHDDASDFLFGHILDDEVGAEARHLIRTCTPHLNPSVAEAIWLGGMKKIETDEQKFYLDVLVDICRKSDRLNLHRLLIDGSDQIDGKISSEICSIAAPEFFLEFTEKRLNGGLRSLQLSHHCNCFMRSLDEFTASDRSKLSMFLIDACRRGISNGDTYLIEIYAELVRHFEFNTEIPNLERFVEQEKVHIYEYHHTLTSQTIYALGVLYDLGSTYGEDHLKRLLAMLFSESKIGSGRGSQHFKKRQWRDKPYQLFFKWVVLRFHAKGDLRILASSIVVCRHPKETAFEKVFSPSKYWQFSI